MKARKLIFICFLALLFAPASAQSGMQGYWRVTRQGMPPAEWNRRYIHIDSDTTYRDILAFPGEVYAINPRNGTILFPEDDDLARYKFAGDSIVITRGRQQHVAKRLTEAETKQCTAFKMPSLSVDLPECKNPESVMQREKDNIPPIFISPYVKRTVIKPIGGSYIQVGIIGSARELKDLYDAEISPILQSGISGYDDIELFVDENAKTEDVSKVIKFLRERCAVKSIYYAVHLNDKQDNTSFKIRFKLVPSNNMPDFGKSVYYKNWVDAGFPVIPSK